MTLERLYEFTNYEYCSLNGLEPRSSRLKVSNLDFTLRVHLLRLIEKVKEED